LACGAILGAGHEIDGQRNAVDLVVPENLKIILIVETEERSPHFHVQVKVLVRFSRFVKQIVVFICALVEPNRQASHKLEVFPLLQLQRPLRSWRVVKNSAVRITDHRKSELNIILLKIQLVVERKIIFLLEVVYVRWLVANHVSHAVAKVNETNYEGRQSQNKAERARDSVLFAEV
jgi:hypothetical protein